MAWVLDYNTSFVVTPGHLLPKCWPAHPGLAREIAAMFSHWMSVFHSPASTPQDATNFYRTVLPGLPGPDRPLARRPSAAVPVRHAPRRRRARDRIAAVAAAADETRRRLAETYAQRLASTRSAPEEAPLDPEEPEGLLQLS